MSRWCTVLYAQSELTWFQRCQRSTCTYICLGIVIYSVLLIALLGIHVAENLVSSQGAFVCLGCRLHIVAQARREAEGHLCLCPCDSRGHAYKGRISLLFSPDAKEPWGDTFANYLVWGICALFRDKTDRYTLVIHAPIHAVSSRFSA